MIASKEFKIILIFFVIFTIFLSVFINHLRKKIRARSIYSSLKERIITQGDVTIDPTELNKNYGEIDEWMWKEIDKLRAKDQKIVYYETEMLHWKLL